MRSTPEAQPELVGRFGIAVTRLARRMRSQRRSDTLSSTKLAALHSLYRLGALTPRELAACERVQPPTVTRIAAALEDLGLLSRRSHPNDRRQMILQLTPAGTELVAAADSASEHWLGGQLATLTDGERTSLAEAIPIMNRIANS
ncbi:MAG TPA: MarR family transcriptional regulator [Pseudonocardia sp.]|jgi:DNA-binding MarR family transcriptional regulator|nr:MarR family transcriptional regulator [Pseudonocardia sp.]